MTSRLSQLTVRLGRKAKAQKQKVKNCTTHMQKPRYSISSLLHQKSSTSLEDPLEDST